MLIKFIQSLIFLSESELACSREQWQHYLNSINAQELLGDNEMLFHFWTEFKIVLVKNSLRNESLICIDSLKTSGAYIGHTLLSIFKLITQKAKQLNLKKGGNPANRTNSDATV